MAFRITGPGLAWFDEEPDENKRLRVYNLLASLLERPESAGGRPVYADDNDPTEVAFVPGTDIVVTYLVAPELDRIFIESIEDLSAG